MAKEKQEEKERKEREKDATEKVVEYFKLGIVLFGSDDPPYNINELKEDNYFYPSAKKLAEELEIDWEKMSHEESNRIMLSLLDDYFNAINVDGDYKFTLKVTAEPKKKE